KAANVQTASITNNQPAAGTGMPIGSPGSSGNGSSVVSSFGQAGVGNDGGIPPGYEGMVTAPFPDGISNDTGREGTPTNHGPLNTLVGPNNIANDHTPCGSNGVIQSETAIATSGNTVVVGYNDFRGFYCPGQGFQVSGWAYSTDRGRTFTDGHSLPGGTAQRGDAWLVTGPDGSIYMSALWNGTSAMDVMRGTVDPNTGLVSWSSPTVISGGGSFDKESMSIDPNSGGPFGTLYVTYTRLGAGIYL